ncbi:MAG: LacI family DNA-binding transcriptional regulator [Pseudomonadota bacterium]|nr:LacI family DNA-binding transcriptional regulator [Pseudomonadota bacterium]
MSKASSSRSRATGRVTLAEVARAAGVSPITASRALRSDRNVAAELVERVRAAAAALAYEPDRAAQSLASSRSCHVVVLVPLLSNRVFAELLEAAQDELMGAGYQTLFGVTHYDADAEERLLRGYLASHPAGVLLTGSERSSASRGLLARRAIPHVHLMELLPSGTGYSVGFSQAAAGQAVTAHLLEGGRRRVAYAAAQLDPRVMQRREGYRAAVRSAGQDGLIELLDPRPSSLALGAELFERLLATDPTVDAIFFCNDDLAQGALLAAQRLGVAVPERVALAGFNDLEGNEQMCPPLTSVRTHRDAIGRAGARMLLTLLSDGVPDPGCLDVGFELKVRGSSQGGPRPARADV